MVEVTQLTGEIPGPNKILQLSHRLENWRNSNRGRLPVILYADVAPETGDAAESAAEQQLGGSPEAAVGSRSRAGGDGTYCSPHAAPHR